MINEKKKREKQGLKRETEDVSVVGEGDIQR